MRTLTNKEEILSINLEEPISSGYPAQPGLIGESVRLSVCPIRSRSCSTNIVIDATAKTYFPLGATNARGVGREQRGNLRGGCMSKLCVE